MYFAQRDAEAAQARERLPGLGSETALLTADFKARAAVLYALLQNSKLLVRRACFYWLCCCRFLAMACMWFLAPVHVYNCAWTVLLYILCLLARCAAEVWCGS